MSDTTATPSFCVISGRQVHSALERRHREIVDLVEAAYRSHGAGDTVNPPSYFLRFPDRPSSRIIALPASLGGEARVDGIKWISSFPDNVAAGIPRASAVLILNDHDTGYPFACLESSIISATRTAASATLAAERLTSAEERPRRIGFFGVGLIARYVHDYLRGTGWSFDEYGVFDLSAEYAAGYADYLGRATDGTAKVRVHESAEELVRGSDLLVFATTAGTPHVSDPDWFSHNPVVLHLSLRDLSPEIVLAATNVVDDVEHCLKAGTSLHLAGEKAGHRDFVDGTLDDVLGGRLVPAGGKPIVFSPFGLGVLDLAVGKRVYDTLRRAGELAAVDDFFHELRRYG
ncbi:2,3-diaminopropionate biosynthesis protein SbnB [Streptomyces canus]|uniref:2,3-diaminopropionate biosynthesis protein SbnB n=1 Tax=Streptomyces canus TaxID=58343 RepID=A0A117R055_9ACTN|nr:MULTISPECIES: 2,3-diaminopropionate biosynthesis protein SbnB [Streptomyces]KUN63896.1 2,3-diaminopropionate biosynthesis protein SbnB [Streptomyces canus]MDI5903773.1 2,3-diaminopropionate biosynthesis protein SbnB [Streptomyces sp. 12257]